MREIKDHVANPVNDSIRIYAADEPGAGGANHLYDIHMPTGAGLTIHFQEGPINEVGVNGLTQEILLALVIDRLRSFQVGPFACAENADALTAAEASLAALISRTKKRMARGVEGRNIA